MGKMTYLVPTQCPRPRDQERLGVLAEEHLSVSSIRTAAEILRTLGSPSHPYTIAEHWDEFGGDMGHGRVRVRP